MTFEFRVRLCAVQRHGKPSEARRKFEISLSKKRNARVFLLFLFPTRSNTARQESDIFS